MSEMQKTIGKSISFSGAGIHTGVATKMTLKPAEENTGIRFIRVDLDNHPEIKADVTNVFATERSTSLRKGDAKIHTVEHILAAITGAKIDNIIIEVDNVEIPILDGSAKRFSEKIEEAGLITQNAKREYFEIKRPIIFTDEETGSKLAATPSDYYEIDVEINYNSRILGIQHATLNTVSDFKTEIASSRTFCFLHELEELIDNNLVKGGDINNAIVIVENKLSNKKLIELKKVFNNPKIKVSKSGYLNNLTLRHKNEAARHKLLDIVGDLSLVGRPIKGKITALKPGHKNNTKFAKKLKEIMMQQVSETVPEINFKEAPLYNKERIKKILPHRDPFLFIDEIREIGEDFIIGVKFVRADEEYFKGHFPDEPVMPGVLQLETMAQTGGVLILSTVPNPEDYLTFFMKIEDARFKQKVVPGDTIIFRLNLISPIRRGLCHMRGVGFVNGKIVVEANLLAKIAPKK
ncbi:MAG: UDP-3-O-[3-hydroxymyristoyl] N-acetylglucosamine deacetylase [Flavobacteriales bacterium]|nr:UDP-3-O-[3-hydroxymyristoyl] N-acetylglucosamine deacetylase [Flavobacteriales bacterium]|tara:strand:+ start:121 stop:1512 length:1392 start_codon:yes stop_codon:yes gene_type:complete